MGVKKTFAKKALNYNRKMGHAFNESPGPLALSLLAGAAVAFGGGYAVDAYKPLENQPQMGQEASIQQHQTALTQLQEQRDALISAQGNENFTPGLLTSIIETAPADQAEKAQAERLATEYNRMMEAFIGSVHIDTRLNEQDAKQLVTAFEAAHGDVDDVTSFQKLDYNDLFEARSWAAEEANSGSELERAKAVNERADQTREWGAFLGGGIGTAAAPWLLMLLIAIPGGMLRRWETEKPKPKKTQFKH